MTGSADHTPDVVILVFNDHGNAFSSRSDPDLRLRHRRELRAPADEGWGPRVRCRTVIGHPELAAHIAQSVILDEFDLTLVNKMTGRPRLHGAPVDDVRPA